MVGQIGPFTGDQRQPYPNGRARAELAFDRDSAAVSLGDGLGQRQTETRAFGREAPPVAAAATMKVPASIRSAMMA